MLMMWLFSGIVDCRNKALQEIPDSLPVDMTEMWVISSFQTDAVILWLETLSFSISISVRYSTQYYKVFLVERISQLWWDFDAEKRPSGISVFFCCWYWESLMDFFHPSRLDVADIRQRRKCKRPFEWRFLYFLIQKYFQSVGAESDKGYSCPGICRLSQAEEDVSIKW